MLCVWWDQESVIYYELLKPSETVNRYHRYHQQLIKLHRALREKRLHYRKRQADFPPRQRTIAHVNNGSKLFGDTQVGSYATPSHLFTRPGTFWLSSVFVDGPHACWAALRFLRRSKNGLMSGLPRKMRNFFGVAYTNCPKDGKNV